MADPTPQQWAQALLKRLGIHPSAGAVKAVVGWTQAEGGHWKNDARFNPLNTTQYEPGAGNTGSQGNIKAYRDWDQGLEATVKTLKNGRYGGILSALQKGDAGEVASAIGASPWGTSGGLVSKTIGGAPAAAPAPVAAAPVPTPAAATPGVDNSPLRRQAVSDFLAAGGVKSSAAAAQLAVGYTTARDTPGVPASPVGDTTTTTTPAGSYAARADTIDAKRLPYKWGGGHGGKVDPATATPLDCSGAVSAVLGIDPRVSGQFTAWGKPGDGGNKGVTIFANGHHVLMKIDGHYWGTSSTNPGGGAGWIPQSAISPGYLQGFTARHQ